MTIAEIEQPILIEDDDDDDDARMTGGSAGSASADPKATTAVPVKRRPPLKVLPSSRPKAVLKSAPSAATRIPPPVEGTLFQGDQQWHLTSGWPTLP